MSKNREKKAAHKAPQRRERPALLARETLPGWIRFGLPLAIFAIAFIAFIPAIDGQFLNWDDDFNFVENPNWRGLGPAQVAWMFTAFHQGHYQPLTWLTLGLDYELWGHDAQGNLSPRGYHFTNILLHAVNAVLVYWLAARLIGTAVGTQRSTVSKGPISSRQSSHISLAAAAAALLWAVHPLRVESVAWMTERRDLVSGLLLLLTMLAYLRYVAAEPGRRARWYGLVVVLFVMSLMGKVIGVTLPVVMLIIDWYPLRRFSDDSSPSPSLRISRSRIVPLILEKLPLLLIALVFGSIVTHFDRERGWLVTFAEHPLQARIAQSFYGLVFYVWKAIAPVNLVPLYEMDRGMNPIAGPYLAYTLLVATAAVMILILRKRVPGMVVAALAYVILLGPTLGMVQTGPQLVADRYTYLSCIGWSILIGAGLWGLLQWKPQVGKAGLAAAVIAIGVLACASWQQSKVWKDNFTLWEYACARKQVKSTYSWAKYGLLLRDRNDLPAAEVALERAIEIRPELSKAHNYLGSVHKLMGRLDDALADFHTAMTLEPKAYEPAYNYAFVLMNQNRLTESADAFYEALKRTPADTPRLNRSLADAHGNLGIVLLMLNRRTEAAEHINQAKALDPSRAQALDDWARSIR